jgi:hypothetical protein
MEPFLLAALTAYAWLSVHPLVAGIVIGMFLCMIAGRR